VDNLVGLKENVIVGRPIPAGTGSVLNRFRRLAAERDKQMAQIAAAQNRVQSQPESPAGPPAEGQPSQEAAAG
jgi:DNA-directed RNA polymerase subunit beta'